MGGRRGSPHGGASDALEMLERCHQRLAEKIELLVAAARRWAESGDHSALDDAREVSRFLDRAATRHAEDEEHSIFPRLSERTELEDVIRVLRAEHRDHERECGVLAALVAVSTGPDAEELSICASRLASAYRAHLVLEDSKLMPAVRELPPPTLQAIYGEMQARRGR